jgi:hypothetical protein
VSDAFRYAEQRRHVFESDTSSTPLALGLEKRAVIAQSTHFDAARTLDAHIAVAVWRDGHKIFTAIPLYAFLTTRRESAQTVARAQQSQSFGRKRAASARFMAKRQ